MKIHTILAAIDRSPLSPTVFDQALSLAQTHQARLILFSCFPPELVSQPTTPPEMGLYPDLADVAAMESQRIIFDEQTQLDFSHLR